jgi:flagellar protein FlgJ
MDAIPASHAASPSEYAGFARPQNVRQAAQQFEALMISQLLKTARESGDGGWLGTDEDDAGAPMLEMAEEHLAQMLASSGGLGLANIIAQGLEKQEPSANSPNATAPPNR